MAFEQSVAIDHPLDEVFAWHAREGAIQRLMPPWQPVRVVQEADSLADGKAVLGLPAGLKWVATHDAGEYDPPHRFVDVLTTPVLSQLLTWRHTHDFEADGSSARVVDRVDTRIPGTFLKQMFAYRSRQLIGDLDSHARHAAWRPDPLTVAITGASGLIGTALAAFLSTGGHRVVKLVRGRPGAPDHRHWDPDEPESSLFDGVDAVVHLAGASIAGRFSRSHKDAVRQSRVGPTRRLAELAGTRPFICASAIGFYGADRGDEELTEESDRGDGFLADLVSDWEADCEPARQSGGRVVNVRTGIVQSPKGGSLQLLRPLFETGLGGRLGDGQAWTAWIGIDDLLDVYLRCLVDPEIRGPVNAVAPGIVRNQEYTKTLAKVLRRPAVVPVPSFGPKLLLGSEGADEVAEASQRVLPTRLLGSSHQFRHPDLESALRHVLGKARTGEGGSEA